jgi:hypothetical protein
MSAAKPSSKVGNAATDVVEEVESDDYDSDADSEVRCSPRSSMFADVFFVQGEVENPDEGDEDDDEEEVSTLCVQTHV